MKSKIVILLLLIVSSCSGQVRDTIKKQEQLGGPCQGCEAVFEYGDRTLTPTDTLPDFIPTEPKIKLTGTVFKKDGKTPARDVILYIYHTNLNGIYATKGNEAGWAKTHGYVRGWVKTDKTGNYTFFTFRPGAYPGGTAPEHIHITVKEPDKKEYYIDSVVFDDDPLLHEEERKNLENRGGSGIVIPEPNEGFFIVKRDIILGLNIPHYE